MNLFQGANGAATFLILSALVAGLAKFFDTLPEDPMQYFRNHLEIVYLGAFVVLFRIKAALDDHKHFAESYQDQSKFRYVGFVLAVFSWIFWALAAYLLHLPIRASEFMAMSVLISTLWVVAHILEIRADPVRRDTESLTSVMREKWVLVNILYMLCLVAYVGWFRPVVEQGE